MSQIELYDKNALFTIEKNTMNFDGRRIDGGQKKA